MTAPALDQVPPLLREPEAFAMWNRPQAGSVPGWVRATVLAACSVTIALALFGAHAIWNLDRSSIRVDAFWFRNALAIGLGIALVAIAIPRGPASRVVRLAVALPLAHLVVTIIAWRAWVHLEPQLVQVADTTPFTRELSAPAAVVALAVIYVGAALVIGRRRRGEWIHAVTILALLHLLLLGLWLPVASRMWWQEWMWLRTQAVLVDPMLALFVLAPPLLVAIAFTVLVVHRPEAMRRAVPVVATVGICGLIASFSTRVEPPEGAMLVFGNFTHVLAVTAVLATVALALLGVVLWRRAHRGRRMLARTPTQTGRILVERDDDTAVIACITMHWLRGPRVMMRPFAVETASGPLHVPAAELAMPLPRWTTALHGGEAVVVLRHGDPVTLGGFVEPDVDHPFRASPTPLPGPDGLVVATQTSERWGFANVAHALWRPCVAYLVILTAIALPALAALLR